MLSLAVSVVVPIAVDLELVPPNPSLLFSESDTAKFEFSLPVCRYRQCLRSYPRKSDGTFGWYGISWYYHQQYRMVIVGLF